MSDRPSRQFQSYAWPPMDPQRIAELAGFDLSLIDESLRSSPEQRVLQHQQALTLVLELEKVGKEFRERAESTPAATD